MRVVCLLPCTRARPLHVSPLPSRQAQAQAHEEAKTQARGARLTGPRAPMTQVWVAMWVVTRIACTHACMLHACQHAELYRYGHIFVLVGKGAVPLCLLWQWWTYQKLVRRKACSLHLHLKFAACARSTCLPSPSRRLLLSAYVHVLA